jgi:hypothetical protein
MELPNIEYRGNISKDILAKDDYFREIHYFKTSEDFIDEQSYSKFVKEVERLVRTNPDYKVYVDYIKHVLGVDFCQVFSHVYDKVDATIELHHGPIFSLYDICEIELQRFIMDGLRINVFRVADSVLDLHFNMKVNCVMLTKTVHEMAHNGDLFLNQNIGDVASYIRDRHRYFTPEIRYKIWNYYQLAKDNPSFDRGVLDLETVKTFIKAGGVEND